MSFTLLSKKIELVTFAPTNSAANSINESIIYTIFRINNRVKKIINAKLIYNGHINFV